ncbi:short chain dehydrogenase [Chitinophaga silvatica]|uniref:Short chain dehydrogenase n=1 Tax=Chitinophaga silvatica TaxID=2282649 RepID=A0A3E1YAU1_9BACT|nr:SDR family oxidoreductase [Chitinophaga silvatica]RFS22756.1 short chain dehydrogenase [Chitinophaga silvatica]
MQQYKDKVVLITGGNSGIGKELALLLARQQAKLILVARNIPALEAARNECRLYTPNCEVIQADVTDEIQVKEAAERAVNIFGRIDVLVNNAGVTQRSKLIDTSVAAIRQLMEINFFGAVIFTKALLPHFKEQQQGQIIVISSMAGLMGYPWRSGYNAAKHALQGYFETLQTEQPIPQLYTTIICPGRIHTPITYAAITGDGSPYGKMDPHQEKGLSVHYCAREILKAMAKRKKVVLIAREEKLLYWIKKWCRPLFYWIARKGN